MTLYRERVACGDGVIIRLRPERAPIARAAGREGCDWLSGGSCRAAAHSGGEFPGQAAHLSKAVRSVRCREQALHES